MLILFILIFILLISLSLFLISIIAKSSRKLASIVTFFFDYVFIFYFIFTKFHNLVSIKIIDGYGSYFFDFVFSLIITYFYTKLLVKIHRDIPILSYIINLFISFLGIWFVYELSLYITIHIFKIFSPNILSNSLIVISKDTKLNKAINFSLMLLLALFALFKRKSKLDTKIRKSNFINKNTNLDITSNQNENNNYKNINFDDNFRDSIYDERYSTHQNYDFIEDTLELDPIYYLEEDKDNNN